MKEQGSEYEFDPAVDLARMDRVHALITTHPAEFGGAAEELDACTSDDVRRYLRVASPAERERFVEDPDTLAGRFEFHLDRLSYRLAGGVPNPGWSWAADVLLAYWIMCCVQAETATRITEFQAWTWEPTPGQGTSRRHFQLMQVGSFWRRWTEAVDKALILAETMGLTAGIAKRAEAKLGTSCQKVLAALREARRTGACLLAKDIGNAKGISEDSVCHSVAKLRRLGWTISNPRGATGYVLDEEPIN